jgi:hypothetical protein
MDEEGDERRHKKARLKEYRELDKVLQTLDYQDHHDLSAHLLVTAQYKKTQPTSKRSKAGRTVSHPENAMIIQDPWTAWPLPSDLVHRPTPIPSSTASEQNTSSSSALHAEIEATILRIARTRIQKEGKASSVSDNEHAPYHVTREITSSVITKLNRLLHSLGRGKYQQLTSERSKTRTSKTKWDEIVGLAGISGCIDSEEMMGKIMERCNKLFDEDMPRKVEAMSEEQEIPGNENVI